MNELPPIAVPSCRRAALNRFQGAAILLLPVALYASCGLAWAQSTGSAQEQLSELVGQLPAPKGAVPGPAEACEGPNPRFESGAPTNSPFFRQPAQGVSASAVLMSWGTRHFGERAYCMTTLRGAPFRRPNWFFLFNEWQKALGADATGLMLNAQVEPLLALGARVDARKAAQAAEGAASGSGSPSAAASSAAAATAAASTITLFGVTLNAPLNVPTCKVSVKQVQTCSPSGRSCWTDPVRVEEPLPTCYVPDRQHIRYDPQVQPQWSRGPFNVRLDDRGRVVQVEFQAASGDAVLRELYTTFGSPTRIDSRNRSQNAVATCLTIANVTDCQQTQQAREWKEYTQVWSTPLVEAQYDEGSGRATVRSLTSR